MKHSKVILVVIALLLVAVTGQAVAQESEQPYVIGLMSYFFSPQAFIDEMTVLGYVEGQNVIYMVPSFENLNENSTVEEGMAEYTRQVQLMVDAGVDIFVTNTDTDAMYLKSLVGDTPIVFSRSDDPVSTGAVADLVTPGGTMTGTITNRPHERRLQILTEIKPSTDKIYYLYSPLTLEAEVVLQQVKNVGDELGVEVIPLPTTDGASAAESLQNIPDGVDWIFLTPYVPFEQVFFEALAATSLNYQVGVSWVTDDPSPYYLVGYGPNINATDRQAARIVDRILRGASPAELPVEIAENYLMVNLEAAEAIGLEIPVGILRQADLIIRPGYFADAAAGSDAAGSAGN